jgi:hypothetical protein
MSESPDDEDCPNCATCFDPAQRDSENVTELPMVA